MEIVFILLYVLIGMVISGLFIAFDDQCDTYEASSIVMFILIWPVVMLIVLTYLILLFIVCFPVYIGGKLSQLLEMEKK